MGGPERSAAKLNVAQNRVSDVCDEAARAELRKLLMLAIEAACFGATWRSGYAAVCKTVYTSSILVVASSNRIKSLRRVLESQALGFAKRVWGSDH